MSKIINGLRSISFKASIPIAPEKANKLAIARLIGELKNFGLVFENDNIYLNPKDGYCYGEMGMQKSANPFNGDFNS